MIFPSTNRLAQTPVKLLRPFLAVSALALTLVPIAHAQLIITEVMPGGSAASYAADWFELTNKGGSALDITGFKMDDNSHAFGTAVALQGITSIASGESVIFMETATPLTTIPAFQTFFGVLSGVQIGSYSGSGVGLSSTTDAVTIFTGGGVFVTGVGFGANATTFTFDNHGSIDPGTSSTSFPSVSALSVDGQFGAFSSIGTPTSVGSPGAIANAATVPEPASYAAVFGAFALAGSMLLRRRRVTAGK